MRYLLDIDDVTTSHLAWTYYRMRWSFDWQSLLNHIAHKPQIQTLLDHD